MAIPHDYMSQSPGGPCVHCGQGPHTSTIPAFRPVDLIFPDKCKLKEEGKCPICKAPINDADFVDDLSRREFQISGMCQKCQDEVFNEDEGIER